MSFIASAGSVLGSDISTGEIQDSAVTPIKMATPVIESGTFVDADCETEVTLATVSVAAGTLQTKDAITIIMWLEKDAGGGTAQAKFEVSDGTNTLTFNTAASQDDSPPGVIAVTIIGLGDDNQSALGNNHNTLYWSQAAHRIYDTIWAANVKSLQSAAMDDDWLNGAFTITFKGKSGAAGDGVRGGYVVLHGGGAGF